jgi:MoxR-like ATPase
VRLRLATSRFVRPGVLWWAFDWESAREQARRSRSPEPHTDDDVEPSNGCVVLIDEIDKADSDVPNGLLEALGAGEFTPLGRTTPVKVKSRFPLVIITTNEERELPAAFVRRCLVLHLKLPADEKELIELLVSRAKVHFPRKAESGETVEAYEKSVDLFRRVAAVLINDRRQARERGVSPLPGQAEYLDLIRALRAMEPGSPESQLAMLEKIKAFALKKNEAP